MFARNRSLTLAISGLLVAQAQHAMSQEAIPTGDAFSIKVINHNGAVPFTARETKHQAQWKNEVNRSGRGRR